MSAVSIPGVAPGDKVFVTTNLILYVQLIADEGTHTLSVVPRGFDSVVSETFEILPEHHNLFLQPLETTWPIAVDPPINEYPVLLDGVPLTTVYLKAHPEGEKDDLPHR